MNPNPLTKQNLFERGKLLLLKFCEVNQIELPVVVDVPKDSRYYHLGTCGFYLYTKKTVNVMVPRCAAPGMGGRAWSWPGYTIDRTPYGVLQHELGHYVDHVLSLRAGSLFSERLYLDSGKEKELTGYLGTDTNPGTFEKEWFAENFRLFVTNPDLSRLVRPRFYRLAKDCFTPVVEGTFEEVLTSCLATPRILEQAKKKAACSSTKTMRTTITYLAPQRGKDEKFVSDNTHEVYEFIGPQPPCPLCGDHGEYESEFGPKGCDPCSSRLVAFINFQGKRTYADWGDTIEKREDGLHLVPTMNDPMF